MLLASFKKYSDRPCTRGGPIGEWGGGVLFACFYSSFLAATYSHGWRVKC